MPGTLWLEHGVADYIVGTAAGKPIMADDCPCNCCLTRYPSALVLAIDGVVSSDCDAGACKTFFNGNEFLLSWAGECYWQFDAGLLECPSGTGMFVFFVATIIDYHTLRLETFAGANQTGLWEVRQNAQSTAR